MSSSSSSSLGEVSRTVRPTTTIAARVRAVVVCNSVVNPLYYYARSASATVPAGFPVPAPSWPRRTLPRPDRKSRPSPLPQRGVIFRERVRKRSISPSIYYFHRRLRSFPAAGKHGGGSRKCAFRGISGSTGNYRRRPGPAGLCHYAYPLPTARGILLLCPYGERSLPPPPRHPVKPKVCR